MRVTVRDIMDLPIFDDAKIVAGYDGINKEIKSVTVAEVPDAANWLRGGELVVTTGYFIKDNKEFQSKWLTDLINGGASALAIKPDRFLGKTPIHMIELANEKSFCLIELPLNITWPAVIESVMNAINDNQNKIIRRTEEIHNKLTQLVLKGEGLPVIAKTIAQLVNNIIVVEGIALGTLAVSCPDYDTEASENFLTYRLSNEYKNKFSSSEYYLDVLTNCNKDKYMLNFKDFCDKFEDISQVTIPIVSDSTVYGFVTLVEFYKKANQIDIIALEHGATTIALEMMKEKIALETEKRLKRNFLDDLIEGKINSDISRTGEYNFIGFDITRPAVAIRIEVNGISDLTKLDTNKVFYRDHENKLLRIIEQYVRDVDPNAFVYSENNKYAMLCHFSVNKEKSEILTEVKNLCKKIAKRIMEDFPKATYNFGIGNIYYQAMNIKKSYIEAQKALKIGKIFMGNNQVFQYSELGIYRLLYMIDKKEDIIEFCSESIGALLEHDKSNNDNLCNYLEAFLENNGNITKASKALYIHPNTFSYRLKKISSILGKDIDDSKTRFNLYFALMIKKLFIDK